MNERLEFKLRLCISFGICGFIVGAILDKFVFDSGFTFAILSCLISICGVGFVTTLTDAHNKKDANANNEVKKK